MSDFYWLVRFIRSAEESSSPGYAMIRWCPVYGRFILKTAHFSDGSRTAFQGFAFGSLFALSTLHANDHFVLAAFFLPRDRDVMGCGRTICGRMEVKSIQNQSYRPNEG